MEEGNTSYSLYNQGTEFWTNLESTNTVLTIANLEREHTMVVRREFNSDAPALPKGKDYHLYFSYHCASPDRDKMKAIVRELEYKGYKCCVLERDFDPTKSLAVNIRQAIEKSYKLVILLSPAYIGNEWCHLEVELLPSSNVEKLFCIPVLLEPCHIPPFLKCPKFINAIGPKEKWWKQFLQVIKGDAMRLPRRKRYHVFIAHAPSDIAQAKEIANDLEAPDVGLVCCYPGRDFKPGAFISKSIEMATKRSLHMIILLSSDFVSNYWKKYYAGKTMIRHQIPFVLEDCSVPPVYKDATIDIRREKHEWLPVLVRELKRD